MPDKIEIKTMYKGVQRTKVEPIAGEYTVTIERNDSIQAYEFFRILRAPLF